MYSPTACITTAIVLPLLGLIAVCLRYWVRLRLHPSHVGPDDIFITIGCLLVCGMGALQVVGRIALTTKFVYFDNISDQIFVARNDSWRRQRGNCCHAVERLQRIQGQSLAHTSVSISEF